MSANLGQSCLATKISAPGPSSFGWFRHTNEHVYRVFNKTTGVVETTVDVKFDESNGAQVEQVDMNLVDDEEHPNLSIMRMGLGEVRPREERSNATVEARNDDLSSSTRVEPSSSQVPQDQSQDHGDDHDHGMCGGTTQNYWARVH